MTMVAFPVGSSLPWDLGMPSHAPQPGLIAMRAMPLDSAMLRPVAELPHLLGPANQEKNLEEDYISSGQASVSEWELQEQERPTLSSTSDRRRKPETRGLNLGKIPMAPGRVANPGMAWFNKTTCDQLQEQLQGSDDQISAASDALTGHVWDLSRHPLGCRLVQAALERSSQKHAGQLAAELRGHVQEAMASPHANYVLQKIVTHLTWQSCGFVAEELVDSGSHFARHRFGCRIFCRLIEFHAKHEHTWMLIEEILQEAEDLCCHPFGHHVAQSVLEHGSDQHRNIVAATIDRNPLGYAKNQNASYLVERVLSSCSECYQESLLSELSADLEDLALSRYGCYVARAVVDHPKTNRPLEMSKLTAIRHELNKTKHGQYLLADLGLGPKHHSNGSKRHSYVR